MVYMNRHKDIQKAVEILRKGQAYPEAVAGMKYK